MKRKNLKLNVLYLLTFIFGLCMVVSYFNIDIINTDNYSMSEKLNLLYLSSHYKLNYFDGLSNIFIGLFLAFSMILVNFKVKKA